MKLWSNTDETEEPRQGHEPTNTNSTTRDTITNGDTQRGQFIRTGKGHLTKESHRTQNK